MELSLLAVSICSLVGVFIVLVFLAVVMHIIMSVFPARTAATGPDNGAMVAAVVSAYARKFPGARISKIEEINTIKK